MAISSIFIKVAFVWALKMKLTLIELNFLQPFPFCHMSLVNLPLIEAIMSKNNALQVVLSVMQHIVSSFWLILILNSHNNFLGLAEI